MVMAALVFYTLIPINIPVYLNSPVDSLLVIDK